MSAKKQEKVAGLWESGVSTTVRDMQWIFRGKLPPETQLTIDGLAETALGDSFICAGDKMFLFELKATSAGKAEDIHKKAHKSIARALRSRPRKVSAQRALMAQLWASMRGHHFVYWKNDDRQRGAQSKTGGLVFSPYIRDVAARTNTTLATYVEVALWLGAFLDDGSNHEVSLTEELSLDRVFTREAYAASIEESDNLGALEPVGLDPEELQSYVDWLIVGENGEDFPIHAIMCSRDGTYFRQVSSLAEVAQLLRDMNREPCNSGATQALKRSSESFAVQKRIPENLRKSVKAHLALRR